MKIIMGMHAPWVGGTRRHVLSLLKELNGRGHVVIFITDPNVLEEEVKEMGIPYYTRRGDTITMIDTILSIIDQEKPDLIHAHPADFILEAFIAAGLTGIPFLVTMHGEYKMHFNETPIGWRISKDVKRVIAVSPCLKEFLIEHTTIPRDKIKIIPNGIDLEVFKASRGVAPRQGVMVGYIGRLDGDKERSILSTARAICSCNEAGYRLTGCFIGKGNLTTELEKIKNRNPKNPLVLYGFRRDLPELIGGMDLVVAAGRGALEAVCCGKPVIVTGKAGYVGLLKPGNYKLARDTNFGDHGSLPSPSEELIKKDLLVFMTNKESIIDATNRLQEQASKEYDLKKITNDILELYEEVMYGPPGI